MSTVEKVLAGEIAALRNDLSRTAHASKFTSSANKTAIEENKRKYEELEARLRGVEALVPTYEHRLSLVEDAQREHTGKIRTMEIEDARDEKKVALETNKTELTKGKLALIGSIVVALLGTIANLVLHFLGG